MIRGKKILSLLLVMVMCFGLTLAARADEISETKKKQEELEEQKNTAEAEKEELNATLNEVIKDMEKTQADMEAKQLEIAEVQDELDVARINENSQYESMKLRIKFMYENGNMEFIEILCASEDIGDFLNKAEYIRQISGYDRKMLVEFQKVRKDVEEKETKLKEEEALLTVLQSSLVQKQEQVEQVLKDKNAELSTLETQLGKTTQRLEELIAAAEEAKRQQQMANNHFVNSGTPGAAQIIGNGQLAWPTTSTIITSSFGWRPIPVAGATSNHDAIDIGAAWGSPVYASDGGTVITAQYGYNGGRGNYIMIDHGNGLITRYQHLNDIYVSVGQAVKRGQNIGTVGNTGASSGPHLDFAVYVNGVTVDPMQFF